MMDTTEGHAHDIVLAFCRSDGAHHLFGMYGMRVREPNMKCLVCWIDWGIRPDLAEGDSWDEVYCQLAASQALDRARVKTIALREAEIKAKARQDASRTFHRRYGRRR
jgi:hypothetical protein